MSPRVGFTSSLSESPRGVMTEFMRAPIALDGIMNGSTTAERPQAIFLGTTDPLAGRLKAPLTSKPYAYHARAVG